MFGGPKTLPDWLSSDNKLEINVVRGFKNRLLGLHAVPDWGNQAMGLLFLNCNFIHTYLLHLPIDIVYLNKNLQIVDFKIKISINYIYYLPKAKHVLELPAGYCQHNGWHQRVAAALANLKS